jgi:hypothetical protein
MLGRSVNLTRRVLTNFVRQSHSHGGVPGEVSIKVASKKAIKILSIT